MNEKIIKTTNRKLENYLYTIGIKPLSYTVLWDGMVEWAYLDTAELRAAHAAYRKLVAMTRKANSVVA